MSRDDLFYDEVAVYPNPSRGEIQLSFKNPIDGQWQLYDQLGKLLLFNTIDGSDELIDLRQFENGLYFLKIFDQESNATATKKVIISR